MTCPYRLQAIALKDVGVFDDVLIHFPPIEDAEADKELAEVHLFTGPNGCGKSTLLYAIARLFSLKERGLVDRRFRSENSTIDYKFNSTPFKLTNTFRESPEGLSCDFGQLTHASEYGSFSIAFDTAIATNFTTSPLNYHYGRLATDIDYFASTKMSYCVAAYSGQRNIKDYIVTAIKENTEHPLKEALSFSSQNINSVTQWIASTITKYAVSSLDKTKEPNQYLKNLYNIQDFIRDISELNVSFDLSTEPLAVTMTVNGDKVPLDTLPDGLESILSWVCDLAQRLERIPWAQPGDIFSQPIILLLDEIDIHLHPKWQRRILPATQKLLPNAQIFASTHSPFVVGSVDHAWIYELPEKGKQREREIKGIRSNPAKSYSLILKEVFDVKEEFGEEIEKQLEVFYRLMTTYRKMGEGKRELMTVADKLRSASREVEFIVDRELRQLGRVKQAS